MDDGQKHTFDLCTRKYIEAITKMRPEFKRGLAGLKSFNLTDWKEHGNILDLAVSFMSSFLQGEYVHNNGIDVLMLTNGRSVLLNYTSSGQQESLWLLNLLLYYMLKNNSHNFFIIEEPESNLFPEWQREIVKFISLVHKAGNRILITTHSPYVLAAINNIRYATILREKGKDVDSIVAKEYAINNLSAYFVGDGKVENIIDEETQMIDNERMDAISIPLNDDLYKLIDLDMGVDNATN
jgi:hypothetical protein